MFPRRSLDQVFAVLLMRSGYEAVAALNFVPIDQFQVQFWKFRASEQEPYNLLYSPLSPRLGDLTDPLYFDFISFSQWAAASQAMRPGVAQASFKEPCESCPDMTYVPVTRNPAYLDDSKLPQYLMRICGDLIYSGLRDGFRGQTFPKTPQPLSSKKFNAADLEAGLAGCLGTFEEKGFCIKARASEVEAVSDGSCRARFTVTTEGPASLWSVSALRSRGVQMLNAYDALAVEGWLRAGGLQSKYTLDLTNDGYVTRWEVL
ncbi:unnamed protein product [Pedinophyceae sp. YPF-701]|nr:unnamed protein product [Pedinophyceae sp. YPF-701]